MQLVTVGVKVTLFPSIVKGRGPDSPFTLTLSNEHPSGKLKVTVVGSPIVISLGEAP